MEVEGRRGRGEEEDRGGGRGGELSLQMEELPG